MKIKSVFLVILLSVLASKCVIEGLQCYVCENCNEHEDFKELHICGEIPVKSTPQPFTLPGLVDTTEPNEVSQGTAETTLKPDNSEDYTTSEENHDNASSQNSTQIDVTTPVTAQRRTTTEPTTLAEISVNTTVALESRTTNPSSTLNEISFPTTIASNTSTSTDATINVSIPVTLPDYDDYLEYEDRIMDNRNVKSLLKINEPVCYMIKYQVNNTVFTNRGCASLINSNKDLTCESLHNGTLIKFCRICSSNGCNKLLSIDSNANNNGLSSNDATALEKVGTKVLLLWILIISFVLYFSLFQTIS